MVGVADGDYISGNMTISIKYGDMETPYTEEIEFTAYKGKGRYGRNPDAGQGKRRKPG